MAGNSTYFIENKALFGPYPSPGDVAYLESIGVRVFVDLTEMNKLPPYEVSPDNVVIKFPIPDMKVPTDYIQFSSLVTHLTRMLKESDHNRKVYVHCRGGNGRAGIVVASLLMCYHNPSLTPLDALQLTAKYHAERKTLKPKWKLVGSPQTASQKNCVLKLFTPFCFSRETFHGNKYGFVPHAKIAITCDKSDVTFEDSYTLFKHLVKSMDTKDEGHVYDCMKHVQRLKVTQCPLFMNNLLGTLLRPIIYCSSHDTFWGMTKQGEGRNLLGRILMEIRDELQIAFYD